MNTDKISAENLYLAMCLGAYGHDPKTLTDFDDLFDSSKRVWQDGADYLNKLIEDKQTPAEPTDA